MTRIATSALIVSLIANVVGTARTVATEQPEAREQFRSRPEGTLTFAKDIAPILFDHCSVCHRPGQSAPFSLLAYGDAKKHAQQIAEVTRKRIMPPWQPEPGYSEFANERRLTTDQIGVIQQWMVEGAREGNPRELPPAPKWSEGWQLGTPDLIIQMPQPYTLPAEGKDVYRNFVIPIPVSAAHYVKAVELQPGNPRIVHHAFMKIDPARQSRRLDGQDSAPGFLGMNVPNGVQMPDGHFLTWQPGKVSSPPPDGLAWRLEKGADLVLQTHMNPTGKPETIQSSVGFYFTETPPTNRTFKILLTSLAIDIPPGATDYALTDSFMLPVDVEALAVLPHAHYLGKELQGYAVLPDGTKKWLMLIRNWDFNWQGDYRYAKPIFLPKGTTLSMRFTYDNSTNNTRNPHQPPQRVRYGPQSTDEMGELWLQVVPRKAGELAVLANDYQVKSLKVFVEYHEHLLRINPDDADAHSKLGQTLMGMRRYAEAAQHLRRAVALRPGLEDAHYFLGLLFRLQKKLPDAEAEFKLALRINPDNFKAHGNLGLIFMETGNLDQAEIQFRSALRVNPDDEVSRENLREVLKARTSPKPN